MSLTPEQKQSVAAWVAAGDSLSAIQKKLAEQFKVSLTYMDVRFLVDDLGLELKNAAPKADASDVSKSPPAAPPPAKAGFLDKLKEKVGLGDEPEEEDMPPDDEADLPPDDLPPAAPDSPGGVKLDLDRIVRPGAVVSGNVTFSDGITGKWALDQYGRLMLETSQKGYQPSPADVQSFQRELQVQLQRQGF
ncbi:MAG: hypothetical protein JNG83_02455 [Opitutaceae bacterium]|nr:hypothetical protein [Opitutaceae bacterium]